MDLDEMLAEYGLDTTSAVLIAVAVCAVVYNVAKCDHSGPACVIEL